MIFKHLAKVRCYFEYKIVKNIEFRKKPNHSIMRNTLIYNRKINFVQQFSRKVICKIMSTKQDWYVILKGVLGDIQNRNILVLILRFFFRKVIDTDNLLYVLSKTGYK